MHETLQNFSGGRHFGHESTFIHHIDPVAHAQQFGHFRADHQDAAALVGDDEGDVALGQRLRLRNTAVTQVAVRSKRLDLVSFNEIPHLAGLAAADWVTYA